ncbi:MAG: 50S ribosomal protein L13 [marine bacterium B5-7]|nr:MAG: 50S ribosomal protein L13 [marine bacterium B5-7]
MKMTVSANNQNVRRDWFLVDANGKTLGRLAAQIAHRLRGKHKPTFTPHVDTGDYIIVINADKVGVTGKKAQDKIYYHHTGYVGGIKSTTFEKLQAAHPTRALERAIKGMLPRGPLGRQMFRKLKVYAGVDHPHQAQEPQTLDI